MPSNRAMGKTYCIQLDNVGARSVSLLVLAHFALTLLQILPQGKENRVIICNGTILARTSN